jgi:hypothetical protein
MKVLIATPMYGGFCTSGYTASMIDFMKKYGSNQEIQFDFMYGIGEALVTRARNMCASIFLKSDATHLLFIDSDIQFVPEQLFKMIQTKNDFVCGIYPKKNIQWNQVRDAVRNNVPVEQLQTAGSEFLVVFNTTLPKTSDGLVEIERAGTGCMMISRKVFDTLSDKVNTFRIEAPVNSNIKFGQDEVYKEYFYTSTDPNTGIFLHEDFTFCRMWRETGGKIYGAPWVQLKHIGNHTYG